MDTLELQLHVAEPLQEILIAELTDRGFHGFLQEASTLKAYIPASQWHKDLHQFIYTWLRAHQQPLRIEISRIPEQNWNQQWEQSLQPIAIGPFIVRPSWKPTPPAHRDKIEIIIDPKMSFGTGYHESTRLLLQMLPEFVQPGDRILDAGTGTGILAIAALKLGARQAVAFDIDRWSALNFKENVARNQLTQQVQFFEGSIEQIDADHFDVSLANINRNVLIDMLPALAAKTKTGGYVLLAGLLTSDKEAMCKRAREVSLQLRKELTENEWWAAAFQRIS